MTDERLARELARNEAALLRGMALTPAQLLLRIPPSIVYLANVAAGDSASAVRREQENRFARLQLAFHAERQKLRADAPALRLFKLSPSMLTPSSLSAVALAGASATAEPSAEALSAAACAERQLLAELEAERAAAARRRPRRKPACVRTGQAASPREAASSSSSAGEEDAGSDAALGGRAAHGPTLEALTAAGGVELSPAEFDPAEWQQVSQARSRRHGLRAAKRAEATPRDVSSPASAAPGAQHAPAPPPARPPLRTGQALPDPQQAEAPAAAELAMREAPVPDAAAEQPEQPRQPARAPSPQAAAAPLPQAQAPAGAAASMLEVACDAMLSGPGGAACALGVARAVQSYADRLIAQERAAHEVALCRALKESHDRSEARAQSLRLRLYISETKCAELQQAVKELERELAARDVAAAAPPPTARAPAGAVPEPPVAGEPAPS